MFGKFFFTNLWNLFNMFINQFIKIIFYPNWLTVCDTSSHKLYEIYIKMYSTVVYVLQFFRFIMYKNRYKLWTLVLIKNNYIPLKVSTCTYISFKMDFMHIVQLLHMTKIILKISSSVYLTLYQSIIKFSINWCQLREYFSLHSKWKET